MLYYIYIDNKGEPFVADKEMEGYILWEICINKALAEKIANGLKEAMLLERNQT